MVEEDLQVLLLEDNAGDHLLIQKMLEASALGGHFRLHQAARLSEAMKLLREQPMDVALVDLGLPDSQGLDTARQVHDAWPGLPLVVFTGNDDVELGLGALQAGAQDFLVKGRVDREHLARAIRYAIERRRMEEQLRQAQRMETLGLITGAVVHDLNNLLMAIRGFVGLAEQTGDKPQEVKQWLVLADQALTQACGVTGTLLSFIRRRPTIKQPLLLNRLMEEFVQLLRPMLPPGIELHLRATEQELWVQADAGQLQQVLMNLAINARDAMAGRGIVTLTLAPGAGGAASGLAQVQIQDNGAGIAAGDLLRIFEPFYSIKPNGTGLGLPICQSILEDHGGAIAVESQLGRGTLFSVTLPCTEQRLEAVVTAPASPGGQRLVLVADDHAGVLTVMGRALEEAGYRVLPCRDGEEAWQQFERHAGEVALLVLDQEMPGITGLECLRRIRLSGSGVPILLVTGTLEDLDDLLGPNEVLLRKPVCAADLAREAGRMLAASTATGNARP